jgi:hypothetical protein
MTPTRQQLEVAYQAGIAAAQAGRCWSDNPYGARRGGSAAPHSSMDAQLGQAWAQGWHYEPLAVG